MSTFNKKITRHPDKRKAQFEDRVSIRSRHRCGRDVELSDQEFQRTVIHGLRALMEKSRQHARHTLARKDLHEKVTCFTFLISHAHLEEVSEQRKHRGGAGTGRGKSDLTGGCPASHQMVFSSHGYFYRETCRRLGLPCKDRLRHLWWAPFPRMDATVWFGGQ